MYINPVGGGPPPAGQSISRSGNAASSGGATQGGEASTSAGQSVGVSSSASSMSISSSQMSASQNISSMIMTFAPYTADENVLKLLLLLIALEIINGQQEDDGKNGGAGLTFLQMSSEQSFQSIEITQSEMSVSYGMSAYSEQSQSVNASPDGGSAGDASTGGGAGQNLDLQA